VNYKYAVNWRIHIRPNKKALSSRMWWRFAACMPC
jgi:hypothetical protein